MKSKRAVSAEVQPELLHMRAMLVQLYRNYFIK